MPYVTKIHKCFSNLFLVILAIIPTSRIPAFSRHNRQEIFFGNVPPPNEDDPAPHSWQMLSNDWPLGLSITGDVSESEAWILCCRMGFFSLANESTSVSLRPVSRWRCCQRPLRIAGALEVDLGRFASGGRYISSILFFTFSTTTLLYFFFGWFCSFPGWVSCTILTYLNNITDPRTHGRHGYVQLSLWSIHY